MEKDRVVRLGRRPGRPHPLPAPGSASCTRLPNLGVLGGPHPVTSGRVCVDPSPRLQGDEERRGSAGPTVPPQPRGSCPHPLVSPGEGGAPCFREGETRARTWARSRLRRVALPPRAWSGTQACGPLRAHTPHHARGVRAHGASGGRSRPPGKSPAIPPRKCELPAPTLQPSSRSSWPLPHVWFPLATRQALGVTLPHGGQAPPALGGLWARDPGRCQGRGAGCSPRGRPRSGGPQGGAGGADRRDAPTGEWNQSVLIGGGGWEKEGERAGRQE